MNRFSKLFIVLSFCFAMNAQASGFWNFGMAIGGIAFQFGGGSYPNYYPYYGYGYGNCGMMGGMGMGMGCGGYMPYYGGYPGYGYGYGYPGYGYGYGCGMNMGMCGGSCGMNMCQPTCMSGGCGQNYPSQHGAAIVVVRPAATTLGCQTCRPVYRGGPRIY